MVKSYLFIMELKVMYAWTKSKNDLPQGWAHFSEDYMTVFQIYSTHKLEILQLL